MRCAVASKLYHVSAAILR
ncbi:hypothetical protein AVEN_174642-1, partial [Araneus ventricosus]